MTSPISYYGGKKAIISHYLDMVPVHDTYTEAFAGGCELYWQKDAVKHEVINDLNDNVVNFYKVLKLKYKPLKRAIDATLYSRSLHHKAYQILINPKDSSDIQRAWAFWVRANFSFANKLDGGLRHSNDMGSMPPMTMMNKKADFTEMMASRLERTYIENTEGLKILKSRNVATAFHEIDTPYFHGPKTIPADQGHYKKLFTTAQFEEVLTWCAEDCKGKFMIHNYNSALLDQFVKVHGWHKKEITHRIKAPRKTGTDKIEVIVWNYSNTCGTLKLF